MPIETFSLQIDRFVEKAKGRTKAFVTEFLQDLNEEVVRATPVDTGFLRGSWWASIGAPETSAGGIDRGGDGAVARMNLVAATMPVGQIYFATNGAAYASFVEYGTARMAPRAFVRGTLARAEMIAEAAARRIAAL